MLIDSFLALLAVALLTGAAFGIGSAFSSCFWFRSAAADASGSSSVERTLLGFGFLSTTALLLGFHCFSRSIIYFLVGTGLACLFMFRGKAASPKLPKRPLQWALLGLALFYLISSLAFPMGDSRHDAIRYHLLGPRVWLFDGFIHPLAHESHTAFPILVETLFAMSMGLANERAPGILGLVFLGLLIALGAKLTRLFSQEQRTVELGMLLLALMPVSINFFDEAFIDTPFTCFVLLALISAFKAASIREWLVAGTAMGFAIACRVTLECWPPEIYCSLPLSSIAAIAIRYWGIFAAALMALTIGSPCYLRNFMFYGTPIFPPPPFMSNVFNVTGLTSDEVNQFQAAIHLRGAGLGIRLTDFALLPFRLTFFPAWFHGAGGFGFAILAFAPIGFFALRQNPSAIAFGLWVLLSSITWFLTQQEARFYQPMAAVLAAFTALGFEAQFQSARKFGRFLISSAMVVSLLYNGAWIFRFKLPRVRSVLSAAAESERLHAEVSAMPAFDILNAQPGVQRILVLRSAIPAFYLRRPFMIWTDKLGPLSSIIESYHPTHLLDHAQADWVLDQAPNWKKTFDDGKYRIYERE